MIDGEPEVLEQHVAGGGLAKAGHADHRAVEPHVLPPTVHGGSFDRHARTHGAGQHVFLVFGRLRVKKLGAGHGNHARLTALPGQRFGGGNGGFKGGTYRSYGGPGSGYQEYHFTGNADDIFGDMFKDIFHGSSSKSTDGFGGHGFHRSSFYDDGSGFGGFGGFGNHGSAGFDQKGQDLNASVSVTFDEAAFGCDKRITLQDQSGKAQTLEVHIPAGIDSGKSIRLRGKGMPGTGKGGAGDLLLKVTVQPKAGYERKGMDVYTTVSIPYTTAVFGGEARVHTLYGDVMCKIKEGTQSGSKIRLRGKGIVSMKDANVHGDQYVTVQIQVPRHLNAEARQKLMEYKKAAAGGR